MTSVVRDELGIHQLVVNEDILTLAEDLTQTISFDITFDDQTDGTSFFEGFADIKLTAGVGEVSPIWDSEPTDYQEVDVYMFGTQEY